MHKEGEERKERGRQPHLLSWLAVWKLLAQEPQAIRVLVHQCMTGRRGPRSARPRRGAVRSRHRSPGGRATRARGRATRAMRVSRPQPREREEVKAKEKETGGGKWNQNSKTICIY